MVSVRKLLLLWLANPGRASALVLNVVNVQPFIFHSMVTVELSADGNVYCGALEDTGSGTYAPSIFQLTSATGLSGHGSASAQAYLQTQVVVSSLAPATVYDIYCYGEDLLLNGLDSAAVAATKQAGINTAAGGDYEAPTFSYITPYEFIESDAIVVYVQLSEDGTVWCVARQTAVWGSAVPTVTEVRNNQDVDAWTQVQVTAASLYESPVRLQGLQPDTLYSVYCFAEDASGNGMDGSPALIADPNAVESTRRSNLKTTASVSASSFQLLSSAGDVTYAVAPATWNLQLPRSVTSGCQKRYDLESWSAPLELLSATLRPPGAVAAAWGCSELLAVPRSGGPYLAVLWRGKCTFAEKAARAKLAGYHGLLVIDHDTQASLLLDMTALDGDSNIEVPAWSISNSDGQSLLAAMTASTESLKANVLDIRRKPRLGDFQADEFGRRTYSVQ